MVDKPAAQIDFTLLEIERLVDAVKVFIDKDDSEPDATVTVIKCGAGAHSGEGLYVFDSDYPDEGSVFLGEPLSPVEGQDKEK